MNTGTTDPRLDGYFIWDPKDPFENRAGPFWAPGDRPEGPPTFAFVAEDRHCNSYGIVHGGMMMTMVDLAMVVTARHQTDDRGGLTVSMSSDFIASGQVGDLIRARAELVKRTNSLCFMRGFVERDGDDLLLNCTAVIKRMRAKTG